MKQQSNCLSKTAGANIKQLIKNSQYKTQEEFAYQFGTDVRTVSRWVNQGIDSIDTISQIADFFDVTVESILF